MQPLDKTYRKQLEQTVYDARDKAEQAARASLLQLGIGYSKAPDYLDEEGKKLHGDMRAHGRQFWDGRDPATGSQEMELLVEEVAYEHWHRMLFSRFLAENDLLMFPDPSGPVSISLEDCQELAPEEGARNGWELASRYAARMLPQIFRPDSPVFRLILSPEHELELERLVWGLPKEVFTASDSLGWVYQFWQAKRKDEVNASEVKIGARELPAVTQLFTEPYMVHFLLDNSLGAWWAHRVLSEEDMKSAGTEEELRRKASLPGLSLEYLRFVKEEDGTWTPAGGTFDEWPENLADFKVMDPCCGSGHFLVAAFLMLVPMRMKLEGLSARKAVDAVLAQNLHGLEIDRRCVELAAFALAFTAWRYPGGGGYLVLPELNLACSGLAPHADRQEWKTLGGSDSNMGWTLDWLYREFQQAPVLGSLLNPAKRDLPAGVTLKGVIDALENLRDVERAESREMGVVAQGVAGAARFLSDHYHWVITNVPYLGQGKQSDDLISFCDENYPEGQSDLATVFLQRCLEFCDLGGNVSGVFPQNWLFLTTYKGLREKLLKQETWRMVARMGAGAFETITGEVVKAILLSICRGGSDGSHSHQLNLTSNSGSVGLLRGLDVSELSKPQDKARGLLRNNVQEITQAKQLENPDSIIVLSHETSAAFMTEVMSCYQGTSTGDIPRFVFSFWESDCLKRGFQLLEGVPPVTGLFQGKKAAVNWDGVCCFPGAAIRGRNAWGKRGIAIGQMRDLPASLFCGRYFSNSSPVIIPHNRHQLKALWSFCSKPEFAQELRKINQKLSIDNGYVGKIPFDLDHWTQVAEQEYPNGLPEPYSDDPPQWIFHGHPCGSVVWDDETKWTVQGPLRIDANVLQVAVARLLGYRWPAELDPDMELSDESRFWVQKCSELEAFADHDGIVCIPAVGRESPASDRLLDLLAAAYGSEWTSSSLSRLLADADHAGKTLESWLRDRFFVQHCKLFQNRPFIWHIWDGLPDGFSALLNYHKLDRRNLETLTYSYLGDWINRQKADLSAGVDGAQEKLDAAKALQDRLKLILEGEAPYDIFVRWKPLEEQPLGWNPDLNDGVRLNIRPFMSIEDIRKRDAGILRDKPNISWKKDRGSDVESAPWYMLGLEYGGKAGDRINDHHLTLEEKAKARGRKVPSHA